MPKLVLMVNRLRTNTGCRNHSAAGRSGVTLVELVVATAVMAIVAAAVLPLFASMRNGADTRWALADMVQNARVLNEHLSRQLAQAKRIVTVSQPSQTEGYLEFEAAEGATLRYEMGSEGYVAFGPPASLSELAGPVTSLTFTCYDANDFTNATDVPDAIRLVAWEATFRSPGRLAEDRTVTGASCLRTNGNILWDVNSATYDFATRRQGLEVLAYAGAGKPQIPDTPDTPSQELTSLEYDAIELDDGDFQLLAVSSQSDFAQARFVFHIDQDRPRVVRIVGTWNGRGVNVHEARTDGASLYIWNYQSGAYELLAASADTELEVTLVGAAEQAAVDYIGGPAQNTIVLLVIFNDGKTGQRDNQLLTDYVRLDVTTRVRSGTILP